MAFTIVADIEGITIYNQAETAQKARSLAADRRLGGAANVRVYDADWSFLGAAALEHAAGQQDKRSPAADGPSARPTVTFKV